MPADPATSRGVGVAAMGYFGCELGCGQHCPRCGTDPDEPCLDDDGVTPVMDCHRVRWCGGCGGDADLDDLPVCTRCVLEIASRKGGAAHRLRLRFPRWPP